MSSDSTSHSRGNQRQWGSREKGWNRKRGNIDGEGKRMKDKREKDQKTCQIVRKQAKRKRRERENLQKKEQKLSTEMIYHSKHLSN